MKTTIVCATIATGFSDVSDDSDEVIHEHSDHGKLMRGWRG